MSMRAGDVDATGPRLSVVVVAHNTPALIRACIERLPAAVGQHSFEVTVVDNGSRPALRVESAPEMTVLVCEKNVGFARAANLGAAAARGELLLFLNSDVLLTPASIATLVDRLEHHEQLAAIAPLGIGDRGQPRSPGSRFLTPLAQAAGLVGLSSRAGASSSYCPCSGLVDVEWLRASTLLVRARLFRALCGFDEGYFFYEEDEDLGWRLRRRGHRLAVDTGVSVGDPGGVTTSLAGSWTVAELYTGQRRFVRSRYGALGELVYRLAVSAALAAKLAAGRRLDRAAAVGILRSLWRTRARASTTAA
jgi:N-acetylglucosaminyl-diphospho-decaprenol L-rhamnosyltransferase